MFSIIMPIDPNRLEQFNNTKRKYDEFPQEKEFLLITRHPNEIEDYLVSNNLMRDVRIIPYELEVFTNPSMAFNIGVRESKYNQIIITSPEVIPKTNVLPQLAEKIGKNVICQVFDQDAQGRWEQYSLVNTKHRGNDPSFYFLAMYNKADIISINGWDEDFMQGYACDDIDFGGRWMRAGLPFEVADEIQAMHQYHPRSETVHNGEAINAALFYKNRDNNVTYCLNGLDKHGKV